MNENRHLVVLNSYAAKTCPERLRKENDPAYEGVQRDPLPAADQMRQRLGVEFERSIREQWQQLLGTRMRVLDATDRSDEGLAARQQVTIAVLADPGDVLVLWQPRLPIAGPRAGEPDALLRTSSGWVPVEVKDHKSLDGTSSRLHTTSPLADPLTTEHSDSLGVGTMRRDDAVQLAHAYRMLTDLGYATPDAVGIVIGRERVLAWFDLAAPLYRPATGGSLVSALTYYDQEFTARLDLVTRTRTAGTDPTPALFEDCASCPFRTVCRDEMKDVDHLTLLPGITRTRLAAHETAGVTTVARLAQLDHATALLVDAGVNVPDLTGWAASVPATTPASQFIVEQLRVDKAGQPAWTVKAQTQLDALTTAGITTADQARTLHAATGQYSLGTRPFQLANSIDQARVHKAGKVCRARGVDSVAFAPARVEVDFDIEDFDGFVYLIGARKTTRRTSGGKTIVKSEFRPFVTWDGTPASEAAVFAEFWAWVTGLHAKAVTGRYSFRAYHYTHHEPVMFAKLAERHAGLPGVPTVEEVRAWFADPHVVDLHPVLTGQLLWPTETRSLKALAKWARFTWRDTDPSGDNSQAWYQMAVSDDPFNPQAAAGYRQRLLDYNEDDCAAQTHLRDWVSRLGQAWSPGSKLPAVESLTARFARKR